MRNWGRRKFHQILNISELCFIKSLTGWLPDIKSHTKIQAYNFNFFYNSWFYCSILLFN